MPIHSLIEYSSNYSDATGRLWFFSKDEATNFNANIANNNNINYKAKISEHTVVDRNNSIKKNTTIAVLFKYLRNFWQSIEIPLIGCKVELKHR